MLAVHQVYPMPARRSLPTDRAGLSHRAVIAGHRLYIQTGTYEDGALGEFFVEVDKGGSTLSALMDQWAIACSLGLQFGVPLKKLCDKFEGVRFEPMGLTDNEQIREAASIIDYICRWLRSRYP